MRTNRLDAPLAVGIDLGTQSVRVVLMDEEGQVVTSSSASLSSIRSEGATHEQDPEAWWEAVGEASRQATGAIGGRDITGLAICSTSGTVLLSEAGTRPLTPAVMYDDDRAEEEARLAQEMGQEAWSSLGYRMQAFFGLPKLLCLLRHGSDDGAARLMHSADFVASRLAGQPVDTDWSHALKTGYDLVEERWPLEVLERLEVPAEILPSVMRPGSVIGEVQESATSHTGLPAGTPIRAGITDSCAAQIAAGALKEGRWNSVLGTTLALKGVTRELLRDPKGVVYSHRHPDEGWLPGGASNIGAGVLSTTFPDRDLRELDEKARGTGTGDRCDLPAHHEGRALPLRQHGRAGL